MRLLAFSALAATVAMGIPGSTQLDDQCTLEMAVTYYSPQMETCEEIKMRNLPTCVEDTVGASDAVIIRDSLYRKCKVMGNAAFRNELWSCITRGGACDDAEPIDQGKYNSTDVKIARAAFDNITELIKWEDDHRKLPGCYSVDNVPVSPPIEQGAIFRALRPFDQKGYAWITCNYHPVHGNWTVTSVHLGMDKLYYTFPLPDGFFMDLDILPNLKTLEISNMGIGKVSNLSDHIWNLNGTLEELVLQKNNLERLATGGYGIENLQKLTKLDLYYNNFDEIPQEIKKLRNLEYLDMGHNILSELPDYDITPARAASEGDDGFPVDPDTAKGFWVKLTSLDTLILSDNNIKNLPATMGSLMSLRVLRLKNNMIRHLPYEISGLGDTLVELDLSNNDLQELPNEMGKLKRLTQLDVSNNELRQLPPNIGNMDGLVWMNLENNKISGLPEELWKMDSIAIIAAAYNEIVYLPNEIGMCKTLSQLLLSNNRIMMVPEELGQMERLWSLDMSNNNFEAMPSFYNAPRLEYMDIRGNNYLRCKPLLPNGAVWNGPLGKFQIDRPTIGDCPGNSKQPTMEPTQPTFQPTCETPSPTTSSDSAVGRASTLVCLIVPVLLALRSLF